MRSDWDITREETNTTFFVDQPDLAESRRIKSTMTHRATGRVVILEDNYTTPSEQDIARAEGLKTDRVEKAMASNDSVAIGSIETSPKDTRTKDQIQIAALSTAIETQQRIKSSTQQLTDSVAQLKSVRGADGDAIDAAAAKLQAQYDDALAAVVGNVVDVAAIASL